jgi:lambda repressor-like predicted transcriptional regulator
VISRTTAWQLAAAARNLHAAVARRDRLIIQMRAEGASLREIATAADLSHTAVAKILTRDINQGIDLTRL